MATYSSTNPVRVAATFGLTDARKMFLYESTAASTDINASGFFQNCGFGDSVQAVGMNLNDILCNHNTSAHSITWHVVTAISSSTGGTFKQTRHATVSAGSS